MTDAAGRGPFPDRPPGPKLGRAVAVALDTVAWPAAGLWCDFRREGRLDTDPAGSVSRLERAGFGYLMRPEVVDALRRWT